AAYRNAPGAAAFLADRGAGIQTWNRENHYGWTPLLIAEGYRVGNFKPAPETIAEIRRIMVANGGTPPQHPPAKATNEEYGDGKNIHQFVLFDITFTFTKQDADNSRPSQSHYYVREPALNPNRPRDWTSPVDYRNGTVHIRIEVLDRPASG